MPNSVALLTKEITKLIEQKKFDEICAVLRKNETTELSARLLLDKATAIQLARYAAEYTLDDARNSLLAAVTLEPSCAEAWLDLGHFYFAVDDAPDKAITCFERARPLCQKLNQDLTLGEVKTLLELGRKAEALMILRSVSQADASDSLQTLQRELQN